MEILKLIASALAGVSIVYLTIQIINWYSVIRNKKMSEKWEKENPRHYRNVIRTAVPNAEWYHTNDNAEDALIIQLDKKANLQIIKYKNNECSIHLFENGYKTLNIGQLIMDNQIKEEK